MTKRYNIYDDSGRKIGTAEEQSTVGDQVVGTALFLYVLWKALPALLILSVIALCIGLGISAFQAGESLVRYGTLDQDEVVVRATAKAEAVLNVNRVAQAAEVLQDQDWYVAASLAQLALAVEPDNNEAMTIVNQVSSHVGGGLVIGGKSGVYYPFGGQNARTFVEGLGGELIGAAPDGQRVLVRNRGVNSILNLANGQFVALEDGVPSLDFSKVDVGDQLTGRKGIKNVADMSFKEIDCRAFSWREQWMRDGRLITISDRDGITVVDTESGVCESIVIPGLESDATALTDGKLIWIVMPGNFSQVENGQLFVANFDGSGLKELTDIPMRERERDHYTLLAPDSSAIYLSEGLMISTRTGRAVQAIRGAVGWVDEEPQHTLVRPPWIEIEPQSGPRGTNFSFQLNGGEPGMEMVWIVNSMRGNGYAKSYIAFVQRDGTTGGVVETDISTEVGPHVLTFYDKTGLYASATKRTVATVTFEVTEP